MNTLLNKKSGVLGISGISSDTYQSVDTGQQLTAEGFNYKVLSVDRVDNNICIPYQYLRSAIYEKRIDMYRSERLFDEAITLDKDIVSSLYKQTLFVIS